MILGLIRHFRVNLSSSKFLYSPTEFDNFLSRYDDAPVISNNVDLGNIPWQICYCSTLKRAIITADTIFPGNKIKTDLICEVPLNSFTQKNIRLPAIFWHIGARIAWRNSHISQLENASRTKERSVKFFQELESCGFENIFIVSHGFFLSRFTKLLTEKGLTGKIDTFPRNGHLYIFKR